MYKLENVKLANTIKVGNSEPLYFQSDKYDLTLNDKNLILIVDKKTKSFCVTSIYNTVSFTPTDESIGLLFGVPKKVKNVSIKG